MPPISTAGATQSERDEGAIGLVSYGSRERVYLHGPSVASWLVFVNGTAQLSAYTQAPQLSSCATPYPNCGTMVIPGSNNSYLYATYKSVSMATQAVYAIKSGNGTKVYDGNTTATGITISTLGGPTGFALSDLNPAPVFYTDSKNVGTYDTLVPSATNPTLYTRNSVDYAVGYFGTGTYTITPKALTPVAVNKQYDGTTVAAISASGLVAGDAATLSGSGSFGSANVGNYTVNVTGITLGGADASNYSLGSNSASASANITPRDLTVSASKSYDGSASFSSVTLGNLVAGESLATSSASANSAHVGSATYLNSLTLSDGSGLASNYQLPSLTGASAANSAVITPKGLTINGLTASNKTYDGNTVAALSGGTLSGLVGSETLSLGALSGMFSDANASVGKAVTLSSAVLGNGSGLASDYTVTTPAGLTADIAQRSLNVSGITAADKTYDGSTTAIVNFSSAQFGNLVAGDVGAVGLSVIGTFADANAAAGKTVRLSSLLTGSATGHYSFGGQATTTAAITPKTITLTGLSAANKVYDGTSSSTLSGGVLSGLVGGETLGFSSLFGSFANANVGNAKAVSVGAVTLSDGSGFASNYTLASPSALSASITPKALSLTATAVDKVYDGNTSATLSNSALTGLVTGETLSLNVANVNFTDKNVGANKAVSLTGVSLVDGSGLASNYTVAAPVGLTAAITPKALSLTGLSAANKVYDGSATAVVSGGALSGLVTGETLTFNTQGASFNDKDAGVNKAVTVAGVSLVGGTGLASNYTVAAPTGMTATITPKALNLTGLTATNKVYDGATSAALSGGSLSGLVGSETLGFVPGTANFADKNAGANKTVAVTGISLTNGSGLASNYTVASSVSLAATISQKQLNVLGTTIAEKTANSSTVGQIASVGSLSGVIQGDVVTLTGTNATAYFAQATPGVAIPVQVNGLGLSGIDAKNYGVPAIVQAAGNILAPAVTPVVPGAPAPVTPSVPPTLAPATPAVSTPTIVADAARYAAPLPELPTPFISSMGYVAVADSSAGGAPSGSASSLDGSAVETTELGNGRSRQPATQGSAESRESKFLSVFVVGGGIQLPSDDATETSGRMPRAPADK